MPILPTKGGAKSSTLSFIEGSLDITRDAQFCYRLWRTKLAVVIYLALRLLSGSSGTLRLKCRSSALHRTSVCHPALLPKRDVRSYFTPLGGAHDFTLTPRLTPRGGIFSVALSVPPAFRRESVAVSHCLCPSPRQRRGSGRCSDFPPSIP